MKETKCTTQNATWLGNIQVWSRLLQILSIKGEGNCPGGTLTLALPHHFHPDVNTVWISTTATNTKSLLGLLRDRAMGDCGLGRDRPTGNVRCSLLSQRAISGFLWNGGRSTEDRQSGTNKDQFYFSLLPGMTRIFCYFSSSELGKHSETSFPALKVNYLSGAEFTALMAKLSKPSHFQ